MNSEANRQKSYPEIRVNSGSFRERPISSEELRIKSDEAIHYGSFTAESGPRRGNLLNLKSGFEIANGTSHNGRIPG